ncbi:hypothetical protein EU546_07200 [Candidatus Thorarchaeota archaeon]|nr:MAG: hypothetical protein EU546_07200 [Candidatus Thorarchaeota archaeon]
MQVKVKLYATLHRLSPTGTSLGEAFDVNMDGSTLSDLLGVLSIEEKQARIVMVNGLRVEEMDHHLSPGDLIVIFPPVGGG